MIKINDLIIRKIVPDEMFGHSFQIVDSSLRPLATAGSLRNAICSCNLILQFNAQRRLKQLNRIKSFIYRSCYV